MRTMSDLIRKYGGRGVVEVIEGADSVYYLVVVVKITACNLMLCLS